MSVDETYAAYISKFVIDIRYIDIWSIIIQKYTRNHLIINMNKTVYFFTYYDNIEMHLDLAKMRECMHESFILSVEFLKYYFCILLRK